MKPYTTLKTKDDLKINLFSNQMKSDKGVILVTHGMGEHALRYAEMARYFTKSGFAVVAFDIRGHGSSEGKRGHTPSYDLLMDDIDRVYDKVKFDFSDTPVVLFGHSMGGNLILNFLLRRKRKIAGAIVTAPYLKLGFEPPKWKIILAKLSSNILPSLSQPTELEKPALTRTPEVVREYEDDHLVHDRITSSFFINVHFAGEYAIDHAHEITTPLLVMHGSEDRLTSPEGTMEFIKNAPDQVSSKIWNGLYHELHNEPERNEVFLYELNWLKELLN
jgi:alpha-beta hydrolase superfamily lysophospholipase